jgi:hypothetical protein
MDTEGETGDLSIEEVVLGLSRRGGVDQALREHGYGLLLPPLPVRFSCPPGGSKGEKRT